MHRTTTQLSEGDVVIIVLAVNGALAGLVAAVIALAGAFHLGF
jgi:hypothetical protein